MAALARSENIYKTHKFSDHAPITVDHFSSCHSTLKGTRDVKGE